MNTPHFEIKNCPGLLLDGFIAYSPLFLRRMFNGRRVSHILPYNAPEVDEEDQKKFLQNQKRISISGVQEKYSMLLDKNNLRLTEENAGKSFKYNYSYEGIAELLKKYVGAWKVEIEKFYRLVIFNFLFSNGDAHLKNFSLLETKNGDPILSGIRPVEYKNPCRRRKSICFGR